MSYNVKNRSASTVAYTIIDTGVRREFMPGEVKKIEFDELEKLSFQPGGRTLIANFLQVQEEEVNQNLNIAIENEYYMNEQQIVDLIRTGDYEQFLDCLDYAPLGVIELVKRIAVDLPMTDTRKIAALREKTGFDAQKAYEMRQQEKQETEQEGKEEVAAAPKRRTAVSYKVTATK